ncbi:MAG: hypothetical protein COV91_04260 [Candidatus Taylorbacteria bacterium CG11_big_fil_rev_8_21_14_0_20_46_11]|uniref:Uncharacterized protein n=1 Tax=Candidatus Taylorbacteria bacterium CG11_big_fil_rev_8_21_14_0_20_46_11 TaxID=1975025 RepID=A0A2H0KAW1_9BACT|nr:MAG: hypothetical protein COV91_04260 [Candidatus Taylorbacteria bacterium CG11_big_fil_rev_8_21_14_0_20_46_11]
MVKTTRTRRQEVPEDADIGTFVPVVLQHAVLVSTLEEKLSLEEADQVSTQLCDLPGPTEPWWATAVVVVCAIIGFLFLVFAF